MKGLIIAAVIGGLAALVFASDVPATAPCPTPILKIKGPCPSKVECTNIEGALAEALKDVNARCTNLSEAMKDISLKCDCPDPCRESKPASPAPPQAPTAPPAAARPAAKGEWSLPVTGLYLHGKAAGGLGIEYERPNGWAVSVSGLYGDAIESGDLVHRTLVHELTTVRVCGSKKHGGHDDHGEPDDHGDGGGGDCIPSPPMTRRTVTTSESGERERTSKWGAAITVRIPLR